MNNATERAATRPKATPTKGTTRKERVENPPVLRFKARLAQDATEKQDSLMLAFPKVLGEQFAALDTTKVEGTINGHPFRANLERNGSAKYTLRVNRAMRAGAGAHVGAMVDVAVLGPEPEPSAPADFAVVLDASPKARAKWNALTPMNRRDWIRWINSVKKPETRAKHIALAGEWLATGKRTPCCFNTYEFTLTRVAADADAKKLKRPTYPGTPPPRTL